MRYDDTNPAPETDPASVPEVAEGSAAEANPESAPVADAGQDTGETPELQAQPPSPEAGSPEISNENKAESTPASEPTTAPPTTKPRPKVEAWVRQLHRYHNDMNGLLAAKENFKIVAVNKSAKQAFYRKWSYEANQVLRLTSVLRRRMAESKKQAS